MRKTILAFRLAGIGIVMSISPLANSEGTKSEGPNSMLLSKPAFFLKIKSSNVIGHVYINGFKQYSFEQRPSGLRIPINPYIISEAENDLSISVLYKDDSTQTHDKDASIDVTLEFADMSSENPEAIPLTSLIFSGKLAQVNNPLGLNSGKTKFNSKNELREDPINGDVEIMEAQFIDRIGPLEYYSRKFNLPKTGLPSWGWINGEDLTKLSGKDIWGRVSDQEYEKIQKSALPTYQNIWQLIRNNKFDSLSSLFEERNSEYDAAFGRNTGETNDKLINALKESNNDPSKKLAPIDTAKYHAVILDNNKVLWLQTYNQTSVIQFDWQDGGYEEYPIYVYRKNGKWIISR